MQKLTSHVLSLTN